ncbi:MAG: hypothetical protein MI748_21195 [Opitutales bacterium]|nr:hypothetical protein [Opitutales bacterium]
MFPRLYLKYRFDPFCLYNYEWKCSKKAHYTVAQARNHAEDVEAGSGLGFTGQTAAWYTYDCKWVKKKTSFLSKIVAPVVIAIVTAAVTIATGGTLTPLIAGIGGFAGGTAGALANGASLGDALRAGLMGGAVSALTVGIMQHTPIGDAISKVTESVSNTVSTVLDTVTGNTLSNAVNNTVTTMIVGGGTAELMGGDFLDGAVGAAATMVGGAIGSRIGESFTTPDVGTGLSVDGNVGIQPRDGRVDLNVPDPDLGPLDIPGTGDEWGFGGEIIDLDPFVVNGGSATNSLTNQLMAADSLMQNVVNGLPSGGPQPIQPVSDIYSYHEDADIIHEGVAVLSGAALGGAALAEVGGAYMTATGLADLTLEGHVFHASIRYVQASNAVTRVSTGTYLKIGRYAWYGKNLEEFTGSFLYDSPSSTPGGYLGSGAANLCKRLGICD